MATSDIRHFELGMDRFLDQVVPEKANLLKRKLALQVLAGVIRRTPVRSGRARANWHVDIDSPRSSVDERLDPGGASTQARGASVIGRARPGQDVWVTNNLAYIGRLEDGHSGQAPAGMVALTVADVRSQAR